MASPAWSPRSSPDPTRSCDETQRPPFGAAFSHGGSPVASAGGCHAARPLRAVLPSPPMPCALLLPKYSSSFLAPYPKAALTFRAGALTSAKGRKPAMCQIFAGQDPSRYESAAERAINLDPTGTCLLAYSGPDRRQGRGFYPGLPVETSFRSAGTAGRGDEFHLLAALRLHDPPGRAGSAAARALRR